MTTESEVYIDNLGICQHCGMLVGAFSGDVIMVDGKMTCVECKKQITREETFGSPFTLAGYKKIRWVGKRGMWVKSRPREDFSLGGYRVICKIGRISTIK